MIYDNKYEYRIFITYSVQNGQLNKMLQSLLQPRTTLVSGDDSFEEESQASPMRSNYRVRNCNNISKWKLYSLYFLVGIVILFPYVSIIAIFATQSSKSSDQSTFNVIL